MQPRWTQATYEAALESVVQYMDHPPAPGTHEDEVFGDLLDGIASYAAEPESFEEAPTPVLSDELDARIAAFRERRAAQAGPEHGIGPTLGMDLSHS